MHNLIHYEKVYLEINNCLEIQVGILIKKKRSFHAINRKFYVYISWMNSKQEWF